MSKHDVFLSYNKADKPAVDEIARQLVKAGIQPWLDEWNLIPGESWQEAIEVALDSCAICAVFVGPSGTGPWQNEEMRAAIQRRVNDRQAGERPFRVIPVLLPGAERGERSHLPTFLAATTWVEFRQTLDNDHAFHRLVCGIRGIEPGPTPGQAIYEGQCPYRGLQFFDVQHAPFFFGREAMTGWLLNELRPTTGKPDTRFLAIIGASGSGKSSLARAGLVAALKRGEIEHSEQWPIYIIRPGPDPLESLAVALSSNTSAALRLIKDLRDDERTLHITTRLMLSDAPQEQRVVVLVDQFEEVFTLCQDDEAPQAFINNLLYAANVVQGQTLVLLTLRADFYGKCAMYPALAAAMSDQQMLVGQMTGDELRHAIEHPAQLAGCEIEHGLVEILLRDVRNQPGGLPLLQHALMELWTRREGRRLTLETYQVIGRAEGALQQRAEMIYSGFNGSEKEICRRIFLRLTQPGEGTEDTKRRVTFQELLPTKEPERAIVESVIQRLADEDARLVVTESGDTSMGQQFVEVAHEAIIQGWSRLREWIEEDRDSLRIHRRLTEDTNEWRRHSKDKDYLYHGGRLAVVAEWSKTHIDELNVLEREFLNASLEWTRQEESEIERRRQQELETAQRFAELRSAVIAAQQFSTLGTAMAALQHRINNTFNLIIPNVTRLRKRVDTTDQTTMEILDIIERNTRYTAKVITRVQQPLLAIEAEVVNVNSVLNEMAIQARELQGTELVHVQLELNDQLPLIRASVGQLAEIFRNLIDNAYRIMPTGGKLIITSQLSDGMICIRVQDTGPGIASAVQQQLFTRPIPPKDPGQGSGLGLWLSFLILQSMGGDITIEKSDSSGTTMLVKLPVSGKGI